MKVEWNDNITYHLELLAFLLNFLHLFLFLLKYLRAFPRNREFLSINFVLLMHKHSKK